jgi:hypothetical protein
LRGLYGGPNLLTKTQVDPPNVVGEKARHIMSLGTPPKLHECLVSFQVVQRIFGSFEYLQLGHFKFDASGHPPCSACGVNNIKKLYSHQY